MEKCKSLQQKSLQIREMSPSRGRLTLGINIYNIQKFSEFALPSVPIECVMTKKVPHVLGPKIKILFQIISKISTQRIASRKPSKHDNITEKANVME